MRMPCTKEPLLGIYGTKPIPTDISEHKPLLDFNSHCHTKQLTDHCVFMVVLFVGYDYYVFRKRKSITLIHTFVLQPLCLPLTTKPSVS